MATAAPAIPTSTVRARKRCYTRKDFVEEWTFPLQPLHDFALNDKPAQYTPGYPKAWGDETATIEFQEAIRQGQPKRSHESYYAAISPDMKVLAISSNYERILVYDIESQELRQTLDGAGNIVFCPLVYSNNDETATGGGSAEFSMKPAYILGCSASDENSRTGLHNQLVLWELDYQGRLLDHEETIDSSAYAAQAINAILPELTKKYEWSREFVEATSLHEDFAKALSVVDTVHRRRHNTTFDDAQFGKFGSTSFSSDGKLFLYHTKNSSTQSGLRETEDLPCVVLVDAMAGKELHRLLGHTDAIMWSAISPNNEHIASVSWDGTLRVYSAITGDLEWVESAGGQSWSGAFSADSKHIVWSSGNGQAVYVQEVHGGRRISTFPGTFRDWCRSLVWHADGRQVALCAGKHAYVWRPFDGVNGEITQHYQIEDQKNWPSMASVEQVAWLSNGRLLHLSISDGTNLIWDTQCNLTELFMHPQGVDNAWVSNGFHGDVKISGDQIGYVSVDGDNKVRLWSSGVVTRSSWWEKVPSKDERLKDTVATKTSFPETGKYVMVTRPAEKGKIEQQINACKPTATDEGAGVPSAE